MKEIDILKEKENENTVEELELPFCIKTEKEREQYLFFKQCTEYLENFKLTRPLGSTSHEYKIIRDAVKVLSPLTKPSNLAEFLKVDTELILYSIEREYIDCLKTSDNCVVKTDSIITFLKKFSILMKSYGISTKNYFYLKYKKKNN